VNQPLGPKCSNLQIFLEFATQKGNDVLLLKKAKQNVGSLTSFWREHAPKNALNLETQVSLANSPLSNGGHIVPGNQKSFVLPRSASQSKPWGRGSAW